MPTASSQSIWGRCGICNEQQHLKDSSEAERVLAAQRTEVVHGHATRLSHRTLEPELLRALQTGRLGVLVRVSNLGVQKPEHLRF